MFEKTSSITRYCIFATVTVIAPIAASHIAKAAAPPDRTPSLVRETSAQFQIAYRMHPEEAQRRQEQLAAVVNAWRSAPHTDANNERLTTWLRAAIRASMPGSREALPASPAFTSAPIAESRSVVKPSAPAPTLAEPAATKPKVAAKPSSTPSKHASESDPFRDDPEVE